MLKKYEVIRLIKQNARCHIVMDCVEGEILVFYLKNHLHIEKEQLFKWFRQIIRQLDELQQVKGENGYGYLTPYCLIVKSDKSIGFLDLKAESNAIVLENMRKQKIQNLFFPPIAKSDIYSLGKTMQFMFAHADIEPKLTKREEIKFQKIISKCLSEHAKKNYQNISDILKEFPKKREKRIIEKKIRRGMALGLIVILAGGEIGYFIEKENQNEREVKKESLGDMELSFDIGLTYFSELQEYEKSRPFFEKSKERNPLGAQYEELAVFMCGKSKKTLWDIEKILKEVEESLTSEEKDIRYHKSLMNVYRKVDTEKARQKSLELGEIILLKKREEEKEIRDKLAAMYKKNQEYDKAIEQYEALCQLEQNESIYKVLIELYELTNQEEKVMETCQRALKDMPDSKELAIIYICMQCKSKTTEKVILEKNIKETVKRMPELLEEPEFQKLQTEYGIKVEGEDIWVEK